MPHGGKNRITLDLVKNFLEIQDPSIRIAVASLVKSLSENPALGVGLTLDMLTPSKAAE
jgi:hypothetical protein